MSRACVLLVVFAVTACSKKEDAAKPVAGDAAPAATPSADDAKGCKGGSGDPAACEALCTGPKPEATCNSIGMVLFAKTTPAEKEAGRHILTAFCDKQHAEACSMLAAEYTREQKYDLATPLWEKGCAMYTNERMTCCEQLALNLYLGRGIARDVPRGHKLLDELCRNGDAVACADMKTLDRNAAIADSKK